MNFSWSGQSCGSTSRLMLHESIYDEVVGLIKTAVDKIVPGDPLDTNTGMGPVNSAKHYAHVLGLIESGVKEGARVLNGGGKAEVPGFEGGYWIQPTVFADVTMDMTVAQEEVFGPVLSILKWSEPEEALAMANQLDLGLTAAIFTHDITTAMDMARRVESGCVWINGTGRHYMGTGFAGWKNSGLGREECLEEVLSYTRSKAIHIIM
ncbi:MAG: aldehyde dehydrogenase family protein, partial [Gammaproteobacteria bacterium]|nr:aldehyde dehydrogenase family protein [Gammaproteobacteria bacterium]